MLRHITVGVFLLICSFSGVAQSAFSELAASYAESGDFERAIELELKAQDLIFTRAGKDNLDYAHSLFVLAYYYSCCGDNKKAISLCEEALIITEKLESKEILNIDKRIYLGEFGQIKSFLSTLFAELGDNDRAIILINESIPIIEDLYGTNSDEYARCLQYLSIIYNNIGNYDSALQVAKKSLCISESIYGPDHPECVTTLITLASIHSNRAEYTKAIELDEKVISIIEHYNLSFYNQYYSAAIQNLSLYYSYVGNFKEASDLLSKLMLIKEQLGENNDIEYADLLHNLALYSYHLGDIDKSLESEISAIDICVNLLGDSHPKYALFLHNLAMYYSEKEDYDKSLLLTRKALKIRENIYGDSHPLYFESLHNLAIYLSHDSTNYDMVIETFKKLLETDNSFTQNPVNKSSILENIGVFYAKKGLNTESQEYWILAKDSYKQSLGINHPEYINSLLAISTNYFLMKNFKGMEIYVKEGSERLSKQILQNFSFLPLTERLSYCIKYIDWFKLSLPVFAYFTQFNSMYKSVYNGNLLSKGLLLNSEMEFDKFLADTGEKTLLEKYNEIKMLRLELNKLYEKPIAERNMDTDSLESHANKLERQLMQESAEFGDYTQNLAITWEQVRDSLKEKDAAIEFVSFPLNNDSTMYVAYVLRPEMESPAMVKLFEGKELKGLSEEKLYSGVEGSKLVWEKLQSEIEGVENVYFSPDGILHQIAIEYFPDHADSTRLISDRFHLNRLTSTRQLALKRNQGKTDKAIVYGGISYDTDPDIMETESRKYDKGTSRGLETYYNVADSLSGLRSGVKYLQFTMKEAKNVSDLLSSGHYNPMLMSGNEATEESFKSLSGTRPGIMHIATHGFYWEKEEADGQAQINERLLFMSQFGDNARRNVEDKALTRTGLFMAGANNALSGKEIPEDIDDGILTASEIANLDLRGTDLVVLSACQTGMGDIGGDGVLGLQRGFKKAGVNSILMSLWDVDDEATQILMTSFYQNYLNGMSKQEALLQAQKTVRETPGFSDPEYWAAFILLDALN